MDEKPVLLRRLRPVWQAWQVLSVGRPIISTGFGASPAPITFRDIDAYAARYGPEEIDDFDELLTLIRSLDAVYLTHEAEKPKPKSGKKGKKGKSRK